MQCIRNLCMCGPPGGCRGVAGVCVIMTGYGSIVTDAIQGLKSKKYIHNSPRCQDLLTIRKSDVSRRSFCVVRALYLEYYFAVDSIWASVVNSDLIWSCHQVIICWLLHYEMSLLILVLMSKDLVYMDSPYSHSVIHFVAINRYDHISLSVEINLYNPGLVIIGLPYAAIITRHSIGFVRLAYRLQIVL